jgi:hypothetical protein
MLKKFAGWKARHILELDEDETLYSALNKLGINMKESKAYGFAIIDGKKIKEDTVLKDGNIIKVFPKSFGG